MFISIVILICISNFISIRISTFEQARKDRSVFIIFAACVLEEAQGLMTRHARTEAYL